MVEAFDERVKNWVQSVIQGAELSMAMPNGQKQGSGVGLYLLEVTKAPAPSTIKRPPLQLSLRYLVTTWAEKSEDAHQALVQLIFAAMENTDFEVELDPIPMAAWTALNTAPRPHFILCVPLRLERPEPTTKRVLEPLKLKKVLMLGFHGQLLGPGDMALAGCRVEIPDLGVSTSTDYQGMFYFPGLPAEGTKHFVITAKGLELEVDSDENHPDGSAPLVIHFSGLEE
jgi:hypothetical protein